jgi:WD40 repeat protein
MVVYDYYDVQGYMASSPKFSYLYDESIADKTIYLESGEWNPKYANSYCPVAGLALDYIYSGRPEKGWKIISKYYSGDEGLALKKKVKEVLSEDSAYVSEEKFKPELLKSLRLNPDNADDVALSLTFSPDGKILALSTLHGNIQLWNTISWNLLVQFRGDDIQIGKVEFSPDGRRLIFVQNNSLYVYDIHSMKKERLFTTQYFSSGNCADFSPNGKLVLFCTGGTVYLLDSFTGKKVAAFKHNMFAVRSKFSPDGKILAVGLENYMGDDLYLWDLSTNKLIMHANPYPYSLAFDPEGTVLAVLEPSYSDGMKPVVKIRNANSGEWVRTFSVECISAFSFRPDGHAIVCGGQKKELQIYDVLTGDVLYALSGHEDNVSNVVYSPDGKLLASVDHSGGLLIWRVP